MRHYFLCKHFVIVLNHSRKLLLWSVVVGCVQRQLVHGAYRMFSPVNENLLRLIATNGEMSSQDLVAKIARPKGNYTDFYGLAAMLHAGYISTDSVTEEGGEKSRGTLGLDAQSTAVFLCQLALPKEEIFTFNDCLRESTHDFPVKFFITFNGLLKIEELDARIESNRQKRLDYFFTALIAIVAAVISGLAASYFTPR